jgi:peptidoglycan/xylan/chitin deacetylase (PgdA/CDA1 family)
MRLFRPGILAGCLYREALFRVKTTEKVLFLTFDDGPDPVSTPQLLHILKEHGIKALFFCIGDRAVEHPELMNQIVGEGHLSGNHGYSHLDGWKTNSDRYIEDIKRASDITSDKIFRPPYGRLSFKQKKNLLNSYKIVFWDLMAYDFDISFGWQNSLKILKNKIRPGSIIVLHDSSSSSAIIILEEFIKYALSKGYRFEMIKAGGI